MRTQPDVGLFYITATDRETEWHVLYYLQGAMMSIAFKEHLTISPQAMEKIVVGANQDVRQVIKTA